MQIFSNVPAVQDGESEVPEHDEGEPEEETEGSTELGEEGGERVEKLLGMV